MAHNTYFQFKQFKIVQEKTAMKVNTDGVLLGAWANINEVRTVLDVGTGTGLIALMIAQRCDAKITGLEIEKSAAEEAVQNVQNSKWRSRIVIQNCSFQYFSANTDDKFDLIVSNPPFFSNGIKNANPHLSMARHNHMLPFDDIISGTAKLLGERGKLALILPSGQANVFVEKAKVNGLFLTRVTEVSPFPDKEPNRILMEFARVQEIVQKTQMSVFDNSKKEYSSVFSALAREFYLKL